MPQIQSQKLKVGRNANPGSEKSFSLKELWEKKKKKKAGKKKKRGGESGNAGLVDGGDGKRQTTRLAD